MPAYRWPIPPDNEEGYSDTAVVLFCIPNSRTWRGLITGIIESLSWGWAWDENTGIVKDAQSLGREIFESMCIMDCVDFKRIADALWIDVNGTEKSLTQVIYEDSERDAVGLGDLIAQIEALEPSAFNEVVDFYEFIKVIEAIVPDIKFPSLMEMLKTLMDIRYKRETLAQAKMLTLNSRYIGYALAPRNTADEEETEINSRFKDFLKSPWLLTAIAVLDPSPSGEIALAARFAGILKNAWSFVDGLMGKILAGNVTDPGTPADNVVEAINRLGIGFKGLNVNVSDCEDCGPEIGGSPSTGTPESDYICEVGKWYIGVIIDRLWALLNLQYVEDAPDVQDTQTEWITNTASNIKAFIDSRSAAIFSGEQINENEDEAEYPISDPSTTFINDWGRQFALPQNEVNALFDLLTNGISRKETGQIYNPVRDAYIDVKIDVVYHLNAMEYLTNIIDHQQDILDALTSASDASDARSNMIDAFETHISPPFLDGGVEYKPARRKLSDLLTGQGVFNRLFSTDISQTDIDTYAWRVSAQCASFDFSCMPQNGFQNGGTPLVIPFSAPYAWDTATYPIGDWVTITSTFESVPSGSEKQSISFYPFDDDYTIEIEILSIPAGKQLWLWARDCNDVDIANEFFGVPGPMFQGAASALYIRTDPVGLPDPGTFQVRIRRLT